MSTVPCARLRTLMRCTSAARRPCHRISCFNFSSTGTFFITGNPSADRTHASAPEVRASRRQVLGGALLSGVLLLQGAGDAIAPHRAAAKVSIASLKKGGEGERDIEVTASGIRMSLVSSGHGDPPASGSLVLVDVIGTLEDGTVFLDTRGEGAAPLAFQLGTTNKYVTEGLAQVVETMRGGDVKLAIVPPSLGYGSRGVTFKSGVRVPPSVPLYYEISLLRCQNFPVGLACCSEADFPCIKNPKEDIMFTNAMPQR